MICILTILFYCSQVIVAEPRIQLTHAAQLKNLFSRNKFNSNTLWGFRKHMGWNDRNEKSFFDGTNDYYQIIPENGVLPDKSLTSRLQASSSSSTISTNSLNAENNSTNESFWPPWPFNILTNKQRSYSTTDTVATSSERDLQYQTGPQLIWVYLRERAKIGARQLQQVGSALSFHLPPASPAILLLTVLPTKQKVIETGAESTITKEITSRIMLNVFAKRVALLSLGVTILSWADYEVQKKKRLTPLPLADPFVDIQKALLPPFLPEAIPPIDSDPILKMMEVNEQENDFDHENLEILEEEIFAQEGAENKTDIVGLNIPTLKRGFDKLYKAAPKPSTFSSLVKSWRKMTRLRQREDMANRRKVIMDELLILQQLKKKRRKSFETKRGKDERKKDNKITKTTDLPIGYALVTGASRGLGRAIAVELARWEIPLVLVARDLDKLQNLADELESCYGVNCCVLQADLSKPGVAKKIYETTKKSGILVDILVNNAGVCHYGEVVTRSEEELLKLIAVNVETVTSLSYLYGKDMRKRQRGRILMVSSVVGRTPGGPGVAAYAASKAFGNSLGISMSKEMERYGVGVTCLSPGAIDGVDFINTSGTGDAAYTKFPFYSMSPADVASRGIRAMLLGDTECIPGFPNRFFLKVASPMIPQRVATRIAEFAFSPLSSYIPKLKLPNNNKSNREEDDCDDDEGFEVKGTPIRLLELKSDKVEENIAAPVSIDPFQSETVESAASEQLESTPTELIANP